VTSHYSLSYLFIGIAFLTYITLRFITKNIRRWISATQVALVSSIAFAWYIYVSRSAPFDNLVRVVDQVSGSFLADFFAPQARSTPVLKGLGLVGATSFAHQISSFFFYITEFFILVGFVKLIAKRKETEFHRGYFMIVCLNMAILIMNIVVPRLAQTFLMGRFYRVLLIILAPLCIVGGKAIAEYSWKLRKKKNVGAILVLIVLVPLYLFQIGFVYEVVGEKNWSVSLSMHRMNRVELYNIIVSEQEVVATGWLSKYMDSENSLVYADYISKFHVLTSYGMIRREVVEILSNTTEMHKGAFIYLRGVNVIDGKMITQSMLQWNTSQISDSLNNQNKVYSNGGSDIHKALGS